MLMSVFCPKPETPQGVPLKKEELEKAKSKKRLEECQSDEKRLRQVRIDHLQAYTRGETQKQELQKDYAEWVKKIVSRWLFFIAVVLVAVAGSEYWPRPIKLPSGVLIALVATNVMVLSATFIKGLFANR